MARGHVPWLAIALATLSPACAGAQTDGVGAQAVAREQASDAMVATIDAYMNADRSQPGMPQGLSPAVREAMRTVPREAFIPPELRPYAYADTPLAIGEGQTISQPYIVALMTELSGAGPGSKVLEVGTGSGYQAAVLAALGAEVRSIEIIAELGERAAETLARLGYEVITRIGDGYAGWPEAAPFDAILVTAAAPEVPAPLVEQLAPGGRLVIPVGPAGGAQVLQLITKDADGAVTTQTLAGVRFVPLTREE